MTRFTFTSDDGRDYDVELSSWRDWHLDGDEALTVYDEQSGLQVCPETDYSLFDEIRQHLLEKRQA